MAVRTCAFVACTCPVDVDEAYCTSLCRERGGEGPDGARECACGHLDCASDRGLQDDAEGKAARIAAQPPARGAGPADPRG